MIPPTIILNKFIILTSSSYGELAIPSSSIMSLVAAKLNTVSCFKLSKQNHGDCPEIGIYTSIEKIRKQIGECLFSFLMASFKYVSLDMCMIVCALGNL